jgi:hypothetical protein
MGEAGEQGEREKRANRRTGEAGEQENGRSGRTGERENPTKQENLKVILPFSCEPLLPFSCEPLLPFSCSPVSLLSPILLLVPPLVTRDIVHITPLITNVVRAFHERTTLNRNAYSSV